MSTDTPLLRVMALHALAYCERLFYLEEVEELRVADARVFAGRRLHDALAPDAEDLSTLTFELEDEELGIRGKVDCVKRADGALVPYEHKRGRSAAGDNGPEAWPSDRLQALSYGHLVQRATGAAVPEVRVRYHADHKLIHIPLNDETQAEVQAAVARAVEVRGALERPPVHENPNRCTHCSLAPVCLPEEERLLDEPQRETLRLFPPTRDRQALHVTADGSRVGKSSDTLVITDREGKKTRVPLHTVDQVVLHGNTQISTQALTLCQYNDVGVHWITGGGRYIGSIAASGPQVQRRHRQYEALGTGEVRLRLAQRLIYAKVHAQLQHILRATRGEPRADEVEEALSGLRQALAAVQDAPDLDAVRGHEGIAARRYFEALSAIVAAKLPAAFQFEGRSRRPPRDRLNALLSFGYALLYRDCVAACLAAGLEPAFGILHQRRSAALPLALDLQELFRVVLVDIPMLGALARQSFDPVQDFQAAADHVWLSESGRRKAIATYERRKQDTWRHPVLDYSLSYDRLMELEARLLEKEWTGAPGLFAQLRLR